MERKLYTAIIAGVLAVTAIFGGRLAYAATTLTIPDNYAEILKPGAIKWSDADSTGNKTGSVGEKAIDGIGTLVCYYIPDNYWLYRDSVITRESDKGTYYFIVGYAPGRMASSGVLEGEHGSSSPASRDQPGAPAEYKRGMAAILCSPDRLPPDQSPAIFVEDLQVKFGATATVTAAPEPTTNTTYTDAEFAAEVIKLINAEREKNETKPLTLDNKLCEIAGLKTKEMIDLGYFNHTSPNYGSPKIFAKHYGYDNYSGVGENLYRSVTKNPEEVFKAWMKSDGHRKAVLNPVYTKAGFGRCGNLFFALELAKK